MKLKFEHKFVALYILITVFWVIVSPIAVELVGEELISYRWRHIIFDSSFLLFSSIFFFAFLRKKRMRHEQIMSRLNAIFDQTYQFSGILDKNGKVLKINQTALEFIGLDAAEILGRKFWETDFWNHSDAEARKLQDAIKQASAGKSIRYKSLNQDSVGKLHNIDFSLKPINSGKEVLYLFAEGRDITEDEKSKKALRIKEKEMQVIFDNATSVMMIVNEERDVLKINKTGLTAAEKTESEALGLRGGDVLNCIHAWDSDKGCGFGPYCKNCVVRNTVLETFEKRKGIGGREAILGLNRKSGFAYASIIITTTYLQEYQPPAVLAVIDDVSKLKQVERNLIRSRERYRYFVEKSFEGIFRYEIVPARPITSEAQTLVKLIKQKSYLAECNPVFLESIGKKSKRDVIGRNLQVLLNANLDKLVQEFISNDFQLRNCRIKSGSGKNEKWYEVSMFAITNNKVLTGIWGSQIDITKEVEAQKKYEESQKNYKNLVENSPYILYRFKRDFGGIYFSSQIEKLVGYTADYLQRNPMIWPLAIHPDDREKVEKTIEAYFEGKDFEIEYRIKHKNGYYIWLNDRNIGHYKGDKIIEGIAMDITERKLAVTQLAENEQKFRTLFEENRDSLYILSEEGIIMDVNPVAAKVSKIDKSNIIGQKISELLNFTDFDINEFIDKTIRKQSHTAESKFKTSDKQAKIAELTGASVVYEEHTAVVLNLRDITQKKQRQKELLQTVIETEEKERSRFAQDLHDGLGPLLSTIKLYTQWIEKVNTSDSGIELINKAGNTVEEAIKSVREISNNLSPHILQNFGLISALNSFADRIITNTETDFEIKHNLNDRLNLNIETTVYRILAECINNTIKYAKAEKIGIKIFCENKMLSILYADNGIGFDVEKTFEEKSGNGLFNIQNRLATLNGKLNIRSQEGKGTQIAIEIDTENI